MKIGAATSVPRRRCEVGRIALAHLLRELKRTLQWPALALHEVDAASGTPNPKHEDPVRQVAPAAAEDEGVRRRIKLLLVLMFFFAGLPKPMDTMGIITASAVTLFAGLGYWASSPASATAATAPAAAPER